MTEQEWFDANPRPEASEGVLRWVSERTPLGGIPDWETLLRDAPPEVVVYWGDLQLWRGKREEESRSWPIERHECTDRVRYFGGEWLSGWAGADYRDGDDLVSYSYLGVMRAMVKRGESEERMREFAARAYAHEAQVRALIVEMANDCRRFAEGA
jgi:hypothetical protein